MSSEFEHLLFDGVAGDEAIRKDFAGLADAMDAVDGLRFDCGVPPWIEEKNVVRGGEIEAEAAGFQRDEEQRAVRVGLEVIDSRFPVASFAIKIFELPTSLL